jgi:LmbE family N-acetylglucosaminyl deacetylase
MSASTAAGHSPSLPAARLPGSGQRVLVFAPHPDDEVLGAGGLLYEACRQGAQVHVAFLTSGDGFRFCAAARYRRWPARAAMRRLARDREEEARRALSHLGVGAEQITFLRYPDRGLAPLWLHAWTEDSPHTSPHTGAFSTGEAVPTLYCGAAVLEGIQRLLERAQPDFVYAPDPADDHPDHWAGYCFVPAALERLAGRAGWKAPHFRTCLVHRGEWPQPRGRYPSLSLSPPRVLDGLGVRWEEVILSPEAVAAKSRALEEHRSQGTLAGSFLSTFIRRNELLGDWEHGGVTRDAAGRTEGRACWFPDAIRDRWGRARCGAVDILGIEVEADPGWVHLRAHLRARAAGWPTYSLYWKPLGGSLRTRCCRFSGFQREPGGCPSSIKGSELEVRIPRDQIDGSHRLMVAASVWGGPIQLDRTPWRVVDVQA